MELYFSEPGIRAEQEHWDKYLQRPGLKVVVDRRFPGCL